MEKKFTAYGHITSEGELRIYDREVLQNAFETLLSGTNVTIVFQANQGGITDNLRAYYFGVVVPHLVNAWKNVGYIKTPRECDYEMRERFLAKWEIDEETGWWVSEPHTLKKRKDNPVTRKQFKEYIETIIAWTVQNLDWEIPFPQEAMEERKPDEITLTRATF